MDDCRLGATLPEWIVDMYNLTHLSVRTCGLEMLPGINHLSKLTSLNLSGNLITELTASDTIKALAQCENLQYFQ